MHRPIDYLRGSVLITTILIMGSATLIGFLALSQASLSRITDADNFVKSFTVHTKVYGCMEEVLIQWQKSLSWANSTVTTSFATCNVTVTSPAADQRKAAIRFNDNNYYYGVDVIIDTDTFEIIDLYPSL